MGGADFLDITSFALHAARGWCAFGRPGVEDILPTASTEVECLGLFPALCGCTVSGKRAEAGMVANPFLPGGSTGTCCLPLSEFSFTTAAGSGSFANLSAVGSSTLVTLCPRECCRLWGNTRRGAVLASSGGACVSAADLVTVSFGLSSPALHEIN